MRDLDTDDDNTDSRDSIDGMTVAKIRPRRIPKMHGRSVDSVDDSM